MITETLGTISYAIAGFGGKLIEALVSDFERARPFLHRDPGSDAEWQKLLDELKAASYPRRELCAELQTFNASLGAPDIVFNNIKAFEEKDTFAVITGASRDDEIRLSNRGYTLQRGWHANWVCGTFGQVHSVHMVQDHSHGPCNGNKRQHGRDAEDLGKAFVATPRRTRETAANPSGLEGTHRPTRIG